MLVEKNKSEWERFQFMEWNQLSDIEVISINRIWQRTRKIPETFTRVGGEVIDLKWW
jgi:hypothetical protein